MKSITLCLLTVLSCALAIPSLDWSKVKSNNVYIKPSPDAPKYPSSRVIGGTEVTRNSIPYQVALVINGLSFCGGSLISPDFILTAAHCTARAIFVQVTLGAHNFREAEDTQIAVTSFNIINHPDFSSSTIANDISLIRLSSSITLNNNIQVVPLAPASSGDFAESRALLTGWGRTSDSVSTVSPTLNRVDLTIISNDQCNLSFPGYIIQSHICTSGAGTVGACNGDSGGPLVIDGVQVGIVSFGSSQGCEAGHPTAYARVSAYRSWIFENSGL